MENKFEDIQKLWQAQQPVEFDLASLLADMKKTEGKQRREVITLSIITPLTIGFLFWSMPWRESQGIAISLYLIAFAMIAVLILTVQSKLKKNNSAERFSNSAYLTEQIAKLKNRYTIAGKYMYGYTVLLLLALNISYYILLEPLAPWERISIHLALTGSVAGLMHWQIRRKIKKYDRELKPLIEKMERMLEEGIAQSR
ncbi:hypothetical protein JYB64_04865 [Algoriphagus aestuarii]|nr:hypothetical protein [Algoriphagus aestuarii]